MSASSAKAVLRARALCVGHDVQPVLQPVDLDVPLGAWWALVGPNGCGKTTLLQTIAGRLRPLSGSVSIDGHDIVDAPDKARAALGYVLAPEQLPGRLTLRECLSVFTAVHGREAAAPAVDALIDAWAFAPRLDDYVDRSSLGTRQKLGVLLALVGEPQLLVMDESFNGLDPASGVILKRFLDAEVRAGRRAVLLATHALDIVEQHADVVLLIDHGRVCARIDRAEIAAHSGSLDALLAARAAAARGPDRPG